MHETITAWITKYALSRGVFTCRVEINEYQMAKNLSPGHTQYFGIRDWHRTQEEAKLRVLEMIRAKRRSINKQIAKLDKLEAETLS